MNGVAQMKWDLSGKATFSVGRDVACDIVVPHTSIARVHCAIQFKHSGSELDCDDILSTIGETYLYDVGAKNGTMVSSQPVASNIFLPVRIEKSIIHLGSCDWDFRIHQRSASDEPFESGVAILQRSVPGVISPIFSFSLFVVHRTERCTVSFFCFIPIILTQWRNGPPDFS